MELQQFGVQNQSYFDSCITDPYLLADTNISLDNFLPGKSDISS